MCTLKCLGCLKPHSDATCLAPGCTAAGCPPPVPIAKAPHKAMGLSSAGTRGQGMAAVGLISLLLKLKKPSLAANPRNWVHLVLGSFQDAYWQKRRKRLFLLKTVERSGSLGEK